MNARIYSIMRVVGNTLGETKENPDIEFIEIMIDSDELVDQVEMEYINNNPDKVYFKTAYTPDGDGWLYKRFDSKGKLNNGRG